MDIHGCWRESVAGDKKNLQDDGDEFVHRHHPAVGLGAIWCYFRRLMFFFVTAELLFWAEALLRVAAVMVRWMSRRVSGARTSLA